MTNAMHRRAWRELVRAFQKRPWDWKPYRDFDETEHEPRDLYHPLTQAAHKMGITIRPLTDEEASEEIRTWYRTKMGTVGGLCDSPNEVAIYYRSFSTLVHEMAHALDQRLPAFRWGPQSECVAVAVEHLVCADYVDWMPNMPYARAQGVTLKLLRRERCRIELVYTKVAHGLLSELI